MASLNPTINWTTKQNATMAKAHQNQSFDSVKLADKDAFVFCHSSTSFTFQCGSGRTPPETLRSLLASGPLPTLASCDFLARSATKDPRREKLSSRNNLQQLNTSDIRACVACRCRDGDLATHNVSAVVCTKLSLRRNLVQLAENLFNHGEQLRLITLAGSAALDTADASSSYDLVELPDKDAFMFCNSSTSLTFSTRL